MISLLSLQQHYQQCCSLHHHRVNWARSVIRDSSSNINIRLQHEPQFSPFQLILVCWKNMLKVNDNRILQGSVCCDFIHRGLFIDEGCDQPRNCKAACCSFCCVYWAGQIIALFITLSFPHLQSMMWGQPLIALLPD